MKLTKGKQHKKVVPENTIPLINIVFLMLIFFLIAGTIAPPVSPDLLPPSARDLPQIPPAGDAVEIRADGSLAYHGQPQSLESILARFPGPATDPEKNASDPSGVVHILADKNLSTKALMPVLQAFRAAGHKTIRLVTIREGH